MKKDVTILCLRDNSYQPAGKHNPLVLKTSYITDISLSHLKHQFNFSLFNDLNMVNNLKLYATMLKNVI
jgi:hypothetical protein